MCCPGKFMFLVFGQATLNYLIFKYEPLWIKTRQGNVLSQVVGRCSVKSVWRTLSTLLVYKTAIEFLGWLIGCLLPTEDVNQGLIRYVVHEEKVQETMDSFQFLVKDSKPNVVSGNIFHVQWSLLSFTYTR